MKADQGYEFNVFMNFFNTIFFSSTSYGDIMVIIINY